MRIASALHSPASYNKTVVHPKLTTLSIVGLAISVGLWAVSQVGLTYVPSTQTSRLLLHSGAVEFARLPTRVSTDEFCGDLKADPDIAALVGQIDFDTCIPRDFPSSPPQSLSMKYGNWSFTPGFGMGAPYTAPVPWSPDAAE